jgi:prepilin-type N-terminal cleavage/methylation domain-containing protein
MSRFFKKQGFTLIELMVVIVIIGVLASLAIPRFTEASSKAKAAEAPRVVASWESAYLALVAETGEVNASNADQLIFDIAAVSADSKWFGYTHSVVGGTFTATPAVKIGNIEKTNSLYATYFSATGTFTHGAAATTVWKKMTPNFFK